MKLDPMLRSLALFATGIASIACAASPPAVVAPGAPQGADSRGASPAEPPSKPSPPKRLLRLRPDAETGRLSVRLELTDEDVSRWKLPHPASSVKRVAIEGNTLRYEVAPSAASPCVFELTPNHAVFCGAAVLAEPPAGEDARKPLSIRLDSDDDFYPGSASSFGLGAAFDVEVSASELARTGFVFGDVHHAQFEAPEGRDHAAWLGYFSFDPRWVAAEAAGVRTAADRWLGIRRPASDPTVGLLLSSIADTGQRVRVRPLHRGALVQAGPSAAWGLRARLDLTRHWVQRTVGASVTLDHPGAAWWFDEGVAHAVGLRVLLDAGVVTTEEAAAEVSGWLAEDALSPHAGMAHLPLVKLAAEDSAARRLLAVRGALVATARGGMVPGGLRGLMQQLLHQRSGQKAAALPGALFFGEGSRPGALRRDFESGTGVPVRPTDVGPLVAMVKRRVHRFELGFTSSAQGATVATVKPEGPAARAGLQVGDAIIALDYAEGRTDVPVALELERSGKTLRLDYLPRGRGKVALAFISPTR